jgi:hypothetical protein
MRREYEHQSHEKFHIQQSIGMRQSSIPFGIRHSDLGNGGRFLTRAAAPPPLDRRVSAVRTCLAAV